MSCKIPTKTYTFVSFLNNQIMKRLFVIGFVLIGTVSQSLDMWHPHNVFAAHKRIHARLAARSLKTPVTNRTYQSTVTEAGSTLVGRGLSLLVSYIRPAQAY